jgi:hypothetical protein
MCSVPTNAGGCNAIIPRKESSSVFLARGVNGICPVVTSSPLPMIRTT